MGSFPISAPTFFTDVAAEHRAAADAVGCAAVAAELWDVRRRHRSGMTVRRFVVSLTVLLVLGALSASYGTDDSVRLIVRTVDIDGKALPGVSVAAAALPGDGTWSEQKAVSTAEGRVVLSIPRTHRFTVSAALQGFVPTTLGPIYPPASSQYEVQICMNIMPPAKFIVTSW